MRKIAILFVVAGLVVPAALVSAQEDGAPAGAMLIILDASGSMNTADEDGVSFIDKAKDAVLQLTDALPDDLAVGLRVYGHREPNTDAVRGCQDTELVAPVAPLDRPAIREAVETLEASGFTPIGLSLQEAAADLPEEGPRTIVLISDGEDTCFPPGPDPCRVADDLFGAAFDVRIESVGFLIDTGSAAEQQLRCIAEASGGTYRLVGRADELVAELGQVATDAIDWRPPMTLNGALEQAVAPTMPFELTPDWLAEEPPTFARATFASLLMPGETRWFRFDLWENERLWAFGEPTWPAGAEVSGEIEAIIIDAGGGDISMPPHPEVPQRVSTDEPGQSLGVMTGDPPQGGGTPAGSYLLGFHWDAPAEVFIGSILISTSILAGDPDPGAPAAGALDPDQALVLDFGPFAENGPNRQGRFHSPIAAGETRWFRLDMGPAVAMNVFGLFPANRAVGTGMEGEFTVELLDLEGNPVGGPLDGEWPQMNQAFGDDPQQARVSGTTSLDRNPLPETVLIGFTWEGPAGQSSEVRFDVETDFDPQRVPGDDPPPEEEPPEETTLPATTSTVVSAPEPADSGNGSSWLLILVLGSAVFAAVFAALAIRRRRSGG